MVTESPDVVKCLTNIVNLCFPTKADLINHTDARSATTPLVLIAIFQRLQHFVAGGSMFEYYS